MVRRRGPRLTAAQKAELWRRWREGESLRAIGRALGRISKCVHYIVAGAGGIPPVPRQRAPKALTLAEPETISRGVASGSSLRAISRDLRRAPSTVCREVRRHGGRRRYRAADADLPRGRAAGARSAAAWPRIPRSGTRSRRSSRWSGRPNRSPAGSAPRILTRRPCTSHTKRSTSVCSSRAAACSRKRWWRTCASAARIGDPNARRSTRPGTSSTPSRFAIARPPSRTARFQVIGKAT